VGLWALRGSSGDDGSSSISSSSSSSSSNSLPNAFALRSPGNRVLVLQAPLDAARRQWLTAIAGALVSLQNSQLRELAAAAQQERDRNVEQKRLMNEQQRIQMEQQLLLRRRGPTEGLNFSSSASYAGGGGEGKGTPRLDISTLAGLPLSSLTEEMGDEEEEDEEQEEERERMDDERSDAQKHQQQQEQHSSRVKQRGSASTRASRASNAIALLKEATINSSSSTSSSLILPNDVTTSDPISRILRRPIGEQQHKSRKQARKPLTVPSSSSTSSSSAALIEEDQREMIARLAKEAVQAYILSANSSNVKEDEGYGRDNALSLSSIQTSIPSLSSSSSSSSSSSTRAVSFQIPASSSSTSSSSSLLSSSVLSVSSLSSSAQANKGALPPVTPSSSSSPSLSPSSSTPRPTFAAGGGAAAVGNLSHDTPAAVQMRRRLATLSPCPPSRGTEPGGPSSSFKPLPFARPTTLTAKAAEELMKRRERLTRLAIDFANAANGTNQVNLVDEDIVNRLAVVWASERSLKDLLSGDANNDFSNASSSWKTLGN